jgi:hypothetical protein
LFFSFFFIFSVRQVHAAAEFKALGTFTAGTGAITPPYPTGANAPAEGDIALLVVTSENQAISLTTANGFALLGSATSKAAGTAASNPASRLVVYWKRCVGGDSNPVVKDSGNNTEAQIYLFSGVRTSGDPWDVYAEGNDGGANDTAGVIPGTTTSVTNTLVVLINSTSYNGNSTAEFSGWTNANLSGITEPAGADNSNTANLGGGHGLAYGSYASIGDYGSSTVTLAHTSYKGAMSIALVPETQSPTVTLNTPTDTATGQSATPTFNFTGSDIEGNDIEYNVQVNDSAIFSADGDVNPQVAAATDDAYCATDGTGYDSVGSGYVVLGTDYNNSDKSTVAGHRFQNITIPKGATITSATMNVVLQENSETIATNIYCEDADDAVAFANSAGVKPSDRSLTDAYTAWDLSTAWSAGTGYDSVDFSSCVQEVIDRDGWESGNALVILVKDDGTSGGNNRTLYSYESSTANAATLTVEYTYGTILLDKFSDIEDAGFSAGHPFASGSATEYTIQEGDALDADTTYYWRVAGIDPLGSNAYGEWSDTYSFTTAAGAGLDHYLVTVASPQTAGVCSTGTNTVTAQDASNETVTDDTSTVNMTSTGTGVTFYTTSDCSTPTTSYTLSSGVVNIYYKTNKAQSFTITATKDASTETGTSSSITVNPGSHSRLVITLPSQTFTAGSGNSGSVINQTAGVQFTITSITATDDYFNIITSYSGTKTLAYSGPAGSPTYTTSVDFTSGVSTTTLLTTLPTAETTTITATEGASYGYASSSLTVDEVTPTDTPTPTPTPTITPTPTPNMAPPYTVGWRSSDYGMEDPQSVCQGPGAYDGACTVPASYWVSAAHQMATKFPDSEPGGVYGVGYIDDGGTTAMPYELTSVIGVMDYVTYTTAGMQADPEVMFDAFDATGLKILIGIEPGNADIDVLADKILNEYKHHPSIIGMSVDAEWFKGTGSVVMTAEDITNFRDAVETVDPDYVTAVKHYDTSKLTAGVARVVYYTDTCNYSSLAAAVDDYVAWAAYFSANRVGYQFGYDEFEVGTPDDQDWWGPLGTGGQPAVDIVDAILTERPNTDIFMIYWVDFTISTQFPYTTPTITPTPPVIIKGGTTIKGGTKIQ